MYLNHDRLQQITRGNTAVLMKLGEIALAELPVLYGAVALSLQLVDNSSLVENIHRLKSAIGNFATPELYAEIQAFEAAARDSKAGNIAASWQNIEQKLTALNDEVEQLVATTRKV